MATSSEDAASASTAAAFERLDKWKRCEREVSPSMVYEQNLTRAQNSGFPSCFEHGQAAGLTSHEVAALFGWTTGDFRFVNAIARGEEEVTFDDYPEGVKSRCKLTRDEVTPYVSIITSALRRLPAVGLATEEEVLQKRPRLYRGHRRPVSNELGTVVTLQGFTSATYDADEALHCASQAPASGSSAQRSLLVFEEPLSGRRIAKFSARRGELEVLFPLDSRFEVLPESGDIGIDEKSISQAADNLRKAKPDAELRIVRLKELPQTSDAVACVAKETSAGVAANLGDGGGGGGCVST